MISIIFICKGNMFRSQLAEAIFRKKFKNKLYKVMSFGTTVTNDKHKNKKIGEIKSLYEFSNYVNTTIGVNISNWKCKQLNQNCISNKDIIIVMAEEKTLPKWLFNFDFIYWQIENPIVLNLNKVKRIHKILEKKIESNFG